MFRLDAIDMERGFIYSTFIICMRLTRIPGSKVAGHRGYFFVNDGIALNQALISYGLDYLRKKAYKAIQPPFLMNKDLMAKTAQLDQFDEELYKVSCIFFFS